MLQEFQQSLILLEDEVEEVSLADFPLCGSVDLPELFTEDAVVQSSYNFLLGTWSLQILGQLETFNVPF